MNRLEYFATKLTLADAAASLPLPPAAAAGGGMVVVPSDGTWGSAQLGLPTDFELEIWGLEAVALTGAVLYGGRLHELEFDAAEVTFDGTTDVVELVGHGLVTGDGPVFFATAGGAQPAELEEGTGYYAIKATDDTFKVAASRADALAGTAIDLTGDGTGTTTLSASADTRRVTWSTHDGLLGLAGDGAIDIDVGIGYSKRVPHSPRVFAYALVATLDTGAVSAAITPIGGR